MLRFSLRSLLARRRRSALTALAVLIGVSMISGTFIFTDTIHAAFRQLFTGAAKGADVIVSSRQHVVSPTSAPAEVPSALIARIRAVPDVAAAEGQISDFATVVARNGRVINGNGSPTPVLSYVPPPFSGLTFVAGSPPHGLGQVAIDRETARREGFHVGDSIRIVTGQPVRQFRISGIAVLGSTSLGGATFTVCDLPTARTLYGKQGKVDLIYVAGRGGANPQTLGGEIGPLLPAELVVRTVRGQVDTNVSRISDRLSIITGGLLAFCFIAVLVGAFVIFNTFSITVTQRVREFAILRAVGATPAQVLLSVVTEATTIGLCASVAGLAGGLLAAAGIRALFVSIGFDLPSTSLVLQTRTVIVAVAVGVLVTIAAGAIPALRATRVAPLQALRESAAPPPRGRLQTPRTAIAVLLALAGVVAIFTSSGSSASRLQQSAIGAVALVLGIVMLTPLAIGRLARLVSWQIERRDNVIGRLARENATRNPSRTAVSASSLMIGLALVLFVTIYASGLRASTSRIIHQTFIGDFTIESQDGLSPIPAASAQAAAVVPDVLSVSSLKSANAHLPGAGTITAAGIDPTTIGQVYRFEWVDGSAATLDDLGIGGAIVERDTARSAHLKVGDSVTLTTETGLRTTIMVRGIYTDRALLRGIALSRPLFDQIFHQPRVQEVFVRLAPGADRAAAELALRQALASFPGVVARSEQQLENEVAGRVNSILVLFYALLAMSVLMSLLGIVNTLNLSIYERTRELGMLRAVGMSRRKSRQLIRDESMITAAIGSLVGVCLGIFLAWVITRALAGEGIVFALPWLQVAAVLAVGLLVGLIAAVPPARRAAGIDVLAAIAHE